MTRPHLLKLEIETPDGKLGGILAVPPVAIRLAELAFNAMPLCDQLVAMAERREQRAGNAISCRQGCAACCRHLVPVSLPEAWMLADLEASFPEERRRELGRRFDAANERLAGVGLGGDFSSKVGATAGEQRAIARAHGILDLDCPFLDDESCSIHAQRPSICRQYAVTSPAPNCFSPASLPVVRVEMRVQLVVALSRLAADLLGEEPEIRPLTAALAWAEGRRADSERSWDARLLLEGLVQELGRSHLAD